MNDGCEVSTRYRKKEDASSAYIYNDKSECDLLTWVYGKVSGRFIDCTYGNNIICHMGDEEFLPNLVNERNRGAKTDCFLRLGPLIAKRAWDNILWSPDSVPYRRK